jgi:hypothetical protein
MGLEKGASYVGKVIDITENYDQFPGNAGLTYCHKIIINVSGVDFVAQVCEPAPKQTVFTKGEISPFTVVAFGKGVYTIKKVTVQEKNNPPVGGTMAAVSLNAAVMLFQYQPVDDVVSHVMSAADTLFNWLKAKESGK